jgi:hypothetical protein
MRFDKRDLLAAKPAFYLLFPGDGIADRPGSLYMDEPSYPVPVGKPGSSSALMF